MAIDLAAALSNLDCSWLSVATDGVVVTFLKKEPMPPFLPLAISRGCAERGVVDDRWMKCHPGALFMHCAHRPLMIGGRSDHSDLSLSDQSLKLLILGLMSQVTKKDHFCRGWVGGPGQVTFFFYLIVTFIGLT